MISDIELYEAYATYDEVMDLTEGMIRDIASQVLGTTALQWEGQAIDLGPRFRLRSFRRSSITSATTSASAARSS